MSLETRNRDYETAMQKAATPYSLDIKLDDIDATDTVTFVWQIA